MFSALKIIGGIATTYLEGKQATAKAKAQKDLKIATGEIDWEQSAVDSMKHSWRDEFFSILFSIPLILCFLGEWGRNIVADGFEALSTMPSWYSVTLGALVASSVGIRSVTKFFGGKR